MKGCCFIGHKDCPSSVKDKLAHEIEKLIYNGVKTFYVGTQGCFDKLAYEVLCQFEKRYDIKVLVVLAYLNKRDNLDIYDLEKTVFPDEITKAPLRFAIRRRNSYMIDKSDCVITYLNTPFSNTIANIEEALRKKRTIINLGEYDIKQIVL